MLTRLNIKSHERLYPTHNQDQCEAIRLFSASKSTTLKFNKILHWRNKVCCRTTQIHVWLTIKRSSSLFI